MKRYAETMVIAVVTEKAMDDRGKQCGHTESEVVLEMPVTRAAHRLDESREIAADRNREHERRTHPKRSCNQKRHIRHEI
jgi:hypothetical protein